MRGNFNLPVKNPESVAKEKINDLYPLRVEYVDGLPEDADLGTIYIKDGVAQYQTVEVLEGEIEGYTDRAGCIVSSAPSDASLEGYYLYCMPDEVGTNEWGTLDPATIAPGTKLYSIGYRAPEWGLDQNYLVEYGTVLSNTSFTTEDWNAGAEIVFEDGRVIKLLVPVGVFTFAVTKSGVRKTWIHITKDANLTPFIKSNNLGSYLMQQGFKVIEVDTLPTENINFQAIYMKRRTAIDAVACFVPYVKWQAGQSVEVYTDDFGQFLEASQANGAGVPVFDSTGNYIGRTTYSQYGQITFETIEGDFWGLSLNYDSDNKVFTKNVVAWAELTDTAHQALISKDIDYFNNYAVSGTFPTFTSLYQLIEPAVSMGEDEDVVVKRQGKLATSGLNISNIATKGDVASVADSVQNVWRSIETLNDGHNSHSQTFSAIWESIGNLNEGHNNQAQSIGNLNSSVLQATTDLNKALADGDNQLRTEIQAVDTRLGDTINELRGNLSDTTTSLTQAIGSGDAQLRTEIQAVDTRLQETSTNITTALDGVRKTISDNHIEVGQALAEKATYQYVNEEFWKKAGIKYEVGEKDTYNADSLLYVLGDNDDTTLAVNKPIYETISVIVLSTYFDGSVHYFTKDDPAENTIVYRAVPASGEPEVTKIFPAGRVTTYTSSTNFVVTLDEPGFDEEATFVVKSTSTSDLDIVRGELVHLQTASVEVDTELSDTSENPVQNKVIKEYVDNVTTSKVSVTDIINNLTTNVVDKPLSAAQGVALKALIDAITVPTKLSQLTDDATHRTVTDTEKQTWNAKSTFSGAYADLTGKPTIPAVPTKVSAFENDEGYRTTADAEEWVFTLTNGETVTKKVVLG